MSSESVSIEPVVKTVIVPCTPEEAFRFFTSDFDMWWPAATYSVIAYATEFKEKPGSVVFEQHAGGRVFERARSGDESLWGTVLEWHPPKRVVFTFHPGRDEKTAQTVKITFSAVPGGAKVVLIHSGWEKLAADAQKNRDLYNQGWETVFIAEYGGYVKQRKK